MHTEVTYSHRGKEHTEREIGAVRRGSRPLKRLTLMFLNPKPLNPEP